MNRQKNYAVIPRVLKSYNKRQYSSICIEGLRKATNQLLGYPICEPIFKPGTARPQR